MNEQMCDLFERAGISDSINEEFGIEYLVEMVIKKCAQIAEDTDGNQNTKREILTYFGVKQ